MTTSTSYDFHRAFELEPLGPANFTCAPQFDAFMAIASNAGNFQCIQCNPGYGLTGLLSVASDGFIGPGDVPYGPGCVFLFPGWTNAAVAPPKWMYDLPKIGSVELPPLRLVQTGGATLHAQMAKMLKTSTTSFIGFSVASDRTLGWNSGTCNMYWFCRRSIPDQPCNYTDWRQTISTNLGI